MYATGLTPLWVLKKGMQISSQCTGRCDNNFFGTCICRTFLAYICPVPGDRTKWLCFFFQLFISVVALSWNSLHETRAFGNQTLFFGGGGLYDKLSPLYETSKKKTNSRHILFCGKSWISDEELPVELVHSDNHAFDHASPRFGLPCILAWFLGCADNSGMWRISLRCLQSLRLMLNSPRRCNEQMFGWPGEREASKNGRG